MMQQFNLWMQWLILMDHFIVVQVPISHITNKSNSIRQIQEQKLQLHTQQGHCSVLRCRERWLSSAHSAKMKATVIFSFVGPKVVSPVTQYTIKLKFLCSSDFKTLEIPNY